jgi:hypothetical protein
VTDVSSRGAPYPPPPHPHPPTHLRVHAAKDKRKELNCEGPSIEYETTPATLTSKFISAPAFLGKECKLEKEFGQEKVREVGVEWVGGWVDGWAGDNGGVGS